MERVRTALSRPVSGQSLAMLRMFFGFMLLWDTVRFIGHNRIERYYVTPDFHFTFIGFEWVKPLPEPYIHWAWLGVGALSLLIILGLFYRFAIIAFTLLFGYFFLLDKAQYLNHFYMALLYAALLCVAPANRMWSLDARLFPSVRSETIPYWPVFAVRLQTEVILIYAGIVKIAPDWLRGEPLGAWLRDRVDWVFYGQLFYQDWFILTATWGTIALHLIGAPLLLWKRTRLPVFFIYCAFHISNAFFFNIGIFPWLTIAVTTIFFAPDWPQHFWAFLRGRRKPAFVPSPEAVARTGMISTLMVALLAVWIAVQVVLPARAWVIPKDVAWTGDGHRFSWRMRIYSRATKGKFVIEDLSTGDKYDANPQDFLTRRQARAMMRRPDMIHQFANYLEYLANQRGLDDVAVYAQIEKSLNGRSFQQYTDPTVDLTAVELQTWGPDDWVLPLQMPFRHWQEPVEEPSATLDQ